MNRSSRCGRFQNRTKFGVGHSLSETVAFEREKEREREREKERKRMKNSNKHIKLSKNILPALWKVAGPSPICLMQQNKSNTFPEVSPMHRLRRARTTNERISATSAYSGWSDDDRLTDRMSLLSVQSSELHSSDEGQCCVADFAVWLFFCLLPACWKMYVLAYAFGLHDFSFEFGFVWWLLRKKAALCSNRR